MIKNIERSIGWDTEQMKPEQLFQKAIWQLITAPNIDLILSKTPRSMEYSEKRKHAAT